jgi:hypothetical protein
VRAARRLCLACPRSRCLRVSGVELTVGRVAPARCRAGAPQNRASGLSPHPRLRQAARAFAGWVTLPRRLEGPPPQPDYGAFVNPPVNGVPLQSLVFGSVHCEVQARHRRVEKLYPFTVFLSPSVPQSLSPSVPQARRLGVHRLTCPRQRPFGPDRQAGIRPVTPRLSAWSSGIPAPASRRLSARRHPLVGHPVPPRDCAPLTIGLPGRNNPDPGGVSTFRAYETRPGWVPPLPRDQRCSHDRLSLSGRRLPPLPTARPYHPGIHPVAQG